jgi:hypothetical protein
LPQEAIIHQVNNSNDNATSHTTGSGKTLTSFKSKPGFDGIAAEVLKESCL